MFTQELEGVHGLKFRPWYRKWRTIENKGFLKVTGSHIKKTAPQTHHYGPLIGSDAWTIKQRHFLSTSLTFRMVHLSQTFSNAIFHTVVEQLTRFHWLWSI